MSIQLKTMYMGSENFYNVAQASEKLGCNERVLRGKLGKGEIKGYKRMNKWYILHSDLIEYIQGGKTPKVA